MRKQSFKQFHQMHNFSFNQAYFRKNSLEIRATLIVIKYAIPTRKCKYDTERRVGRFSSCGSKF